MNWVLLFLALASLMIGLGLLLSRPFSRVLIILGTVLAGVATVLVLIGA